MKNIWPVLFKTINVILGIITILGIGVLFFRQLPTDNLHHGYGVLFYSLFLTPLIIFPLFITSLVGTIRHYKKHDKHSVFYLTCLVTAIIGILLAIALLIFDDLYGAISLNPRTEAIRKISG